MITDRPSARAVIAADISELINARQAELNELEFKEMADSDLLKAACAIANFGGGFIVVGLAEDEQHCADRVVNVEKPQRTADSIRQRLRDCLSPRPSIEVVALAVGSDTVVIIRIAPQDPPHMISADKKTDFFSRYDATSERMRYEEIEQRFRDKFAQGQITTEQTPRATLETLSGRREVSIGTAEALQQYVQMFLNAKSPSLGLIAVQEHFENAISESTSSIVFANPSYWRNGGWTVVHPTLLVRPLGGRWQQDYGEAGRTYLNSSGDFVFQKAIDEVICWRQSQLEFNQQPRLYSNALIEYCLSFMYGVADIASICHPKRVLIKAVLVVDEHGASLPLGEGGTVWFDAPAISPHSVRENHATMPVVVESAGPIHVRRLAFTLAAQLYAMFSYDESEVPFSDGGIITFETTTDQAALSAIRSYLRGRSVYDVEYSSLDFDRDVHWFRIKRSPESRSFSLFGVSVDFLKDYAAHEDVLFQRLDALDIDSQLSKSVSDNRLVVTSGGLTFV